MLRAIREHGGSVSQGADQEGAQTSTMEGVNTVDDVAHVRPQDRAHETIHKEHGGNVPSTDANVTNQEDIVASYVEKLAQLQLESDNLKENYTKLQDGYAKLQAQNIDLEERCEEDRQVDF